MLLNAILALERKFKRKVKFNDRFYHCRVALRTVWENFVFPGWRYDSVRRFHHGDTRNVSELADRLCEFREAIVQRIIRLLIAGVFAFLVAVILWAKV